MVHEFRANRYLNTLLGAHPHRVFSISYLLTWFCHCDSTVSIPQYVGSPFARRSHQSELRTGPQEATHAGPDASPKVSASPNAKAEPMARNLALCGSWVCDVTHVKN
jgi:hypothetical protein